MDYISLFREKHIENNPAYPHNDIGIAKLFYDLHCNLICYVVESKAWYAYNGKRWAKDDGGLYVMEMCKSFVQALDSYANSFDNGGEESKAFMKYASGLHKRRRREGLLCDARSIAPKSLSYFDKDRLLLNCYNGTYDLRAMKFRQHSANDYITKIARVKYVPGASCKRWEKFINEITCEDVDTTRFLQKAFGYALSGDTTLECFFILYGSSTRNGKSTLTETMAHMLGDYARTIQPQTLARRSPDGASASPDIARLKGARLVNMPEPEKQLELNTALIKQLTGGDAYTGRFLNENPVEFHPEMKVFINTNHLPKTSDDTVFTSGMVKLIPFERHFKPSEQDIELKKLFRRRENTSGILNWLIEGHRLLKTEGLRVPDKVREAIREYMESADDIGMFLGKVLIPADGNRVKTSDLHRLHQVWAKENGHRTMSKQEFVGELRHRNLLGRDRAKGNVVIGFDVKKSVG